MSERLTRQQIYDRIRQTSRDEFILSEMKRLGFWQTDANQPQLSEALIDKERKLYQELNELSQKQRRYANKQAMLAEMRKSRLEASKKRRQETKAKNEQRRQQKAEAWKVHQQYSIGYLGEGVSGGLNQTQSNPQQLALLGLPDFRSPFQLAQAMGVSLGHLRFLAFNRTVSKISHYKRFYLPKKSGGKRLISAPMPLLKKAQYWILENILYKIPSSEAAHGFVPKKSILSNAQNHTGQDVVVNIDLKDFFPTITYHRVKGLYHKLGYSEQIATILALICTEPEVDIVKIDSQIYYTAKSIRKLPQGAPSSPAITNLICHRLDLRFQGLAQKLGFNYSRYADDLSFSGASEGSKLVGQLLWSIHKIVKDEGFVVHPEKIAVMRKGTQQRVTGIIVNEKVGIDRQMLRKFRALIHHIEQSGVQGKTWNNNNNLEASMRGYVNFVSMIKPEQGAKFKMKLDAIFGQKEKASTSRPIKDIPPPSPPFQDSNDDDKAWWEVV